MKKSYLILLLIFILCYMLIDPVHGMEGVKNGLLLWYDRILPALLPFSIISYILVASDNLSFFSRILHPVIKKLIPVSPDGVYPLLAGFLFGFPLGSKIIGQLSKNGCDAYMLPAILCIYLPPLFFAAIRLRFLKGTASDKKNEASRSQITFKIIDAGIMNGFETLLKLCGYIVIFSILCKPLSLLKNSIPFVSLLFGSILEVTNGISCIAGHGFLYQG